MSGLVDLIVNHADEIVATALSKQEDWPPTAIPQRDWLIAMLADLGNAAASAGPKDEMSIGDTAIARQQGAARRDAHDRPYLLIHDFAMVCDSIADTSDVRNLQLDAKDHKLLNLWLDGGIAAAIEVFNVGLRPRESDDDRAFGLSLAIEVSNAASVARAAYDMLRSGRVGTTSRTSDTLDRSLRRLEAVGKEAVVRLRGSSVS